MIIIENEKVDQIPYLHIAKQENRKIKRPLVIFIHGFTSSNVTNLNYAYLLAEKGFRVVLPEVVHHGNRSVGLSEGEMNMRFWEIIINTINELPLIKNQMLEQSLITENKIAVAGTSMGGITTLGALAQYDWINAAVSLMGAPSYQQFALQQIKSLKENQIAVSDEDVNNTLSALEQYDLSIQPNKIKNRPLMFWHGKQDNVVPYNYAHQFYLENKNDNMQFILDESAEHKVSQDGIKTSINWLAEKLID